MIQRITSIPLQSFPVKYNAEGRKLCQICDKVLDGRRTKYCSETCQEEMMIRTQHDYLRYHLMETRGNRCEKCGWSDEGMNLTMDHKIPIALGGEEFSKDNVWLLCNACDKAKYKEDMKLIAKQRRIEKNLANGQQTL